MNVVGLLVLGYEYYWCREYLLKRPVPCTDGGLGRGNGESWDHEGKGKAEGEGRRDQIVEGQRTEGGREMQVCARVSAGPRTIRSIGSRPFVLKSC